MDHSRRADFEPKRRFAPSATHLTTIGKVCLAAILSLSALMAICELGDRADRAERDGVLAGEIVREQARFLGATLNSVAASARTIVAALARDLRPDEAGRLLEEAAQQPIVLAALLTDDRGRVVAARSWEALPALSALQFKEVGSRRNWAGATLLRGDASAGGDTFLAIAANAPGNDSYGNTQVQLVLRSSALMEAAGNSPRLWLLVSGAVFAAEPGGEAGPADTAALLRRWVSLHPASPRGFFDVAMRDGGRRLYYQRLTEWPMTVILDAGPTPAFGLRPQDIAGLSLLLAVAASIWLLFHNRAPQPAAPQSTDKERTASAVSILQNFDTPQGTRQLAGIVAQEIGNLFTIVSCDAQMAAEMAPSNIALRRVYGSTVNATERGADFNQILLSFAERLMMRPELIDLGREIALRHLELGALVLPGQHLPFNLPTDARQSGGGLEMAIGPKGGMHARLFFPLKQATGRVVPYLLSGLGLPRQRPMSRKPRSPVRVLLVDDDAPVRESIARRLRGLGMEVVEARSVAEAETIAARGVDVLLTEIVLAGGIDGWMLAELVRRRAPGLPVLFMTGFMVAAQTAFLRGDDLTQFIRKPIVSEELLAVIEGLLALCESRLADAAD